MIHNQVQKLLFFSVLIGIETSLIAVNLNPFEVTHSDSTKKTVKVIGVGDMMLGTNYPGASYLPANEGKDMLKAVTPILKSGDVTFGNLEGVILSGAGQIKRCGNPENCYAFKMPDSYVNHFVNAGFDVLSLANNHSNDFGKTGVENTKKLLDESEIAYAGLTDCPSTVFEKNGLKYGFIAFSPNRGTIQINDYGNAKALINELDDKCDIVIVSFHGGAEGSKHTHLTKKTEYYLGENRGNPYEFARIVIDAGADVVFGHGPHVTRAVDLYKGKFIVYSMGNFATYGRFNLSGPNGIAPIIELTLESNGTFISGQIYACKQPRSSGPILDEDKKVITEIKSLNKADLPECPLDIDDQGKISLKSK